MNEKIELGKINSLKVDRVTEYGLFLVSEDEESVLLPNAYIKPNMDLGSIVEVFIYTDSEDRLVATTLTPKLYLNEYGFLKVVDVTSFGAFVDIGLAKDILVPKNAQKSPFKVDEKRFVKLIIDEDTQRLIATQKINPYLSKDTNSLEKSQEVQIQVFSRTPLGFKVLVDDLYEGMIYHTEIFENVHLGDIKKAFIKNIRDDGKIDISLQKIGQKKGDENPNRVLKTLEENGGELRFTYKSDAEEIKKTFAMSKKAFKASLTTLIN